MPNTTMKTTTTMRVRYTNAHGIAVAAMPKNDPLTLHAVESYGYTLNTDARRNRWHSPREFAEAIREVMDCEDEPRNAAVVNHLDALN